MARPTREQVIAIQKRDKDILKMHKQGYPLGYIAEYYSLSKSRISIIIKEQEHADENSLARPVS